MRKLSIIGAVLALDLLLGAGTAHAASDPAINTLARDVTRTESLRAVKTLQRTYAQYAQYGLWDQVGALFADDGRFVFDGLVNPAKTLTGSTAIADFLRTRYGGGEDGASADSLSTMFIEAPVVNLSADGASAKARWEVMIFHGANGSARIEGGVFENDYISENGTWKIATAHYYPEYDGPYKKGWTNWSGGDMPVVPRHYTTETAGIPIPPATGTAPETDATLATLQQRIDTLNDEDRIRNLQSAYGYYQDRKMWDDVVDLFADDGLVEIGGQGVWRGKAGVRRWLESMGPAGLKHGQLNNQVQMDTTVTIAPGGNEAWARGIALGMLGEADQEKGWWAVTVFRNRFVREDGVWKIRELRRFPLMKTDIFKGWGESRITEPAPAGAQAPDAPVPQADAASPGLAMPAFLRPNPVTGQPVVAEGDARVVAASGLTGEIAPATPTPVTLAEARRRLARSAAWDGIANVSAAYGHFIDDEDATGFTGVIATKGFKETPFTGYYVTRARNVEARVHGAPPKTRKGVSYHWLIQPVVLVSDDGRSASGRFRLFQPRTGKTVGQAGDFYAASFWGGMYHNRYVLEDGVWRLWELTLDVPYITPVSWTDGVWAKAKDPSPDRPRRKFSINAKVAPDVPLTALSQRERHMPGGSGDPLQWPSILPMWFSYTNPVSGRMPEHYQKDCVPCGLRPDLRLDHNGYQQPPDAPQANRAP
jgi:hypothetical protein